MNVRSLTLGALAGLTLACGAQAADTTAEGAAALVKSMTGWLPEQITTSGFMTAVPDGDHYNLAVDFSKLVKSVAPPDIQLTVNGSQTMKIYPAADTDGLMTVKAEPQPLDLSAKWEKGPDKGLFTYLVKDFAWDGRFDPALGQFRTGTGHASGGAMTIDDGKVKMDGGFGPLDIRQSSSRNADGTVDVANAVSMADFTQAMSGSDTPPVRYTFSGLTANSQVKGLRFDQIKAIISFLSAHAKDTTLKVEDKKALASMLSDALPVMTSFNDEITIDHLNVTGPGIGAKVDKVTYGLGMTGISDNASAAFTFAFQNPEFTGIPQVIAYGDLVPKDLRLSVTVPNLNVGTAAKAFLDQADFNKAEPLTKEQGDAIGKLFLKDGRIDIEVPELSARSNLYDLSVTGKVSTNVEAKPANASAEFDVTARNIDNTIKGIQELAQRVPDLNTASFSLMMAKGMAKNDPDGTSHWKVEVSEDGLVKINGQQLPH